MDEITPSLSIVSELSSIPFNMFAKELDLSIKIDMFDLGIKGETLEPLPKAIRRPSRAMSGGDSTIVDILPENTSPVPMEIEVAREMTSKITAGLVFDRRPSDEYVCHAQDHVRNSVAESTLASVLTLSTPTPVSVDVARQIVQDEFNFFEDQDLGSVASQPRAEESCIFYNDGKQVSLGEILPVHTFSSEIDQQSPYSLADSIKFFEGDKRVSLQEVMTAEQIQKSEQCDDYVPNTSIAEAKQIKTVVESCNSTVSDITLQYSSLNGTRNLFNSLSASSSSQTLDPALGLTQNSSMQTLAPCSENMTFGASNEVAIALGSTYALEHWSDKMSNDTHTVISLAASTNDDVPSSEAFHFLNEYAQHSQSHFERVEVSQSWPEDFDEFLKKSSISTVQDVSAPQSEGVNDQMVKGLIEESLMGPVFDDLLADEAAKKSLCSRDQHVSLTEQPLVDDEFTSSPLQPVGKQTNLESDVDDTGLLTKEDEALMADVLAQMEECSVHSANELTLVGQDRVVADREQAVAELIVKEPENERDNATLDREHAVWKPTVKEPETERDRAVGEREQAVAELIVKEPENERDTATPDREHAVWKPTVKEPETERGGTASSSSCSMRSLKQHSAASSSSDDALMSITEGFFSRLLQEEDAEEDHVDDLVDQVRADYVVVTSPTQGRFAQSLQAAQSETPHDPRIMADNFVENLSVVKEPDPQEESWSSGKDALTSDQGLARSTEALGKDIDYIGASLYVALVKASTGGRLNQLLSLAAAARVAQVVKDSDTQEENWSSGRDALTSEQGQIEPGELAQNHSHMGTQFVSPPVYDSLDGTKIGLLQALLQACDSNELGKALVAIVDDKQKQTTGEVASLLPFNAYYTSHMLPCPWPFMQSLHDQFPLSMQSQGDAPQTSESKKRSEAVVVSPEEIEQTVDREIAKVDVPWKALHSLAEASLSGKLQELVSSQDISDDESRISQKLQQTFVKEEGAMRNASTGSEQQVIEMVPTDDSVQKVEKADKSEADEEVKQNADEKEIEEANLKVQQDAVRADESPKKKTSTDTADELTAKLKLSYGRAEVRLLPHVMFSCEPLIEDPMGVFGSMGQALYDFYCKPQLPAGLEIDSASGRLHGIPIEAKNGTSYEISVDISTACGRTCTLCTEIAISVGWHGREKTETNNGAESMLTPCYGNNAANFMGSNTGLMPTPPSGSCRSQPEALENAASLALVGELYHFAIESVRDGDVAQVKALVRRGVVCPWHIDSKRIVDEEGCTLLDLARKKGHREILSLFFSKLIDEAESNLRPASTKLPPMTSTIDAVQSQSASRRQGDDEKSGSISYAFLPRIIARGHQCLYQPKVSAGLKPLGWEILPPLPSGLSLDPRTGDIRGACCEDVEHCEYVVTVLLQGGDDEQNTVPSLGNDSGLQPQVPDSPAKQSPQAKLHRQALERRKSTERLSVTIAFAVAQLIPPQGLSYPHVQRVVSAAQAKANGLDKHGAADVLPPLKLPPSTSATLPLIAGRKPQTPRNRIDSSSLPLAQLQLMPTLRVGLADKWTVDPPLPLGMTLDALTGEIIGVPLISGRRCCSTIHTVLAENVEGKTFCGLSVDISLGSWDLMMVIIGTAWSSQEVGGPQSGMQKKKSSNATYKSPAPPLLNRVDWRKVVWNAAPVLKDFGRWLTIFVENSGEVEDAEHVIVKGMMAETLLQCLRVHCDQYNIRALGNEIKAQSEIGGELECAEEVRKKELIIYLKGSAKPGCIGTKERGRVGAMVNQKQDEYFKVANDYLRNSEDPACSDGVEHEARSFNLKGPDLRGDWHAKNTVEQRFSNLLPHWRFRLEAGETSDRVTKQKAWKQVCAKLGAPDDDQIKADLS